MSIVVVDDSPTNLIILKRFSASIFDGEVVGLQSPRAALDYLLNHDAEAVVIDYEMPDLNGIDLIQALRREPRHRQTPLLMVTGHTEADIRVKALEAGATDFLTKPARIGEFKSILSKYLNRGEWHRIDAQQVNLPASPPAV
jgi:DNA-binding response OmpR family regulator